MPSVSIILPTYNRAHTLPSAIKSVLAQTFKDFELIIVDDGSTDDTRNVIKNFTDERIRYIKQDINTGVAGARNIGIQNAKSSLIAFQDSDDEWHPEKLMEHLNTFKNADLRVGIIYSSFIRERADKTQTIIPDASVKQTQGNLYDALFENNWITLQASVIRKSCFDSVGLFDKTFRILDDWEWFLRASKNFDYIHIQKQLVTAHYTPGNLTSQKKIRMEDRKQLLKKHELAYRAHPRALAKLATMIGGSEFIHGNKKEARAYYQKAFRARPLTFSAVRGIIKTFL